MAFSQILLPKVAALSALSPELQEALKSAGADPVSAATQRSEEVQNDLIDLIITKSERNVVFGIHERPLLGPVSLIQPRTDPSKLLRLTLEIVGKTMFAIT